MNDMSRETGGRFADKAIRMRALRRASIKPIRADFAAWIGITENTLSNIENGFPISNRVAQQIMQRMPWASMDWLNHGKEDGLSQATLQRLAPLVEEESDTTLPRSWSSRTTAG